MIDYINVGPSPCDEPCNRENEARECLALIHQLRRMYGNEPEGARLKVKSFDHEFGAYREVVCYYDTNISEAADYAFNCENLPERWDEEAKKELST